jgi:hypothetical protein
MPNLDFYAIGGDLDKILDYVFTETGCRVFESFSAFDADLVEFPDAETLKRDRPVGSCQQGMVSVLLQLIIPSAANLPRIRRIDLPPGNSDGHRFRHVIEGFGMLQLYLGGLSPNGIVASHTSHASRQRACVWQKTAPDLGPVDAWNWDELVQTSEALNHLIKSKLAASTIGSCPVLKEAYRAFDTGLSPADGFSKAVLDRRRAGRLD